MLGVSTGCRQALRIGIESDRSEASLLRINEEGGLIRHEAALHALVPM